MTNDLGMMDAVGYVRVELQDAERRPLCGYQLSECDEIFGDEVEGVVSWEKGPEVGSLARQPIRVRFEMKDADLFGMRFR